MWLSCQLTVGRQFKEWLEELGVRLEEQCPE